jgi:hypothetical protein
MFVHADGVALHFRLMNASCDLQHTRPKQASIRLLVRSNRIDRPGRPMERDLYVCSIHAKQLRQLGVEVVGS